MLRMLVKNGVSRRFKELEPDRISVWHEHIIVGNPFLPSDVSANANSICY